MATRKQNRVHSDLPQKRGAIRERVYVWVKKIPKGRVATYGQISALMNHRISAAAVGWMLHSAPKGIPWQRVVNASGGCSTDRLPDFPVGLQRHLLESEGIDFSPGGTLDLKRFRWKPR